MAPIAVPSALSTGRPLIPVRRTVFGLIAATAVSGLVGCSLTAVQVDSLADAKQIEATCPQGQHIAGRAAIDVSGAMRSVAGDAGRLDPVRQLVRRTVICGGHLRIDAFGGTSAATAALYDGELRLDGATDNAKLRREPALTNAVMAQVIKNLPTAASSLPSEGTDVVSQLGLSAEYRQQLDPDGSRYVLDLVLTTDGRQTGQVSLTDPALDTDNATQLASHVQAPNLSGADVSVTDIGKTPGQSWPTGYLNGLKAFYRKVCAATMAASCVVATDAAVR